MADLISTAATETLLKDTGGVWVGLGSESTYGHLERVPVMSHGGDGGDVLTSQPSLVIAEGTLSLVTNRRGVLEKVLVKELDASGNPTGSGTAWEITRVEPAAEDGGTIRLMLVEF